MYGIARLCALWSHKKPTSTATQRERERERGKEGKKKKKKKKKTETRKGLSSQELRIENESNNGLWFLKTGPLVSQFSVPLRYVILIFGQFGSLPYIWFAFSNNPRFVQTWFYLNFDFFFLVSWISKWKGILLEASIVKR
jgi:hypothetical protein